MKLHFALFLHTLLDVFFISGKKIKKSICDYFYISQHNIQGLSQTLRKVKHTVDVF